jgi:phytoene desaturase
VPAANAPIVIVGAGLGGLSAALRLAGAGRDVMVVERESEPGGRAGRLVRDGYTFDTGPTVLTMPELITDALECVGERLEDWLDLRPLNPAYRAVFADGSRINVHADANEMAAEIERNCGPREVEGYERFVSYARELWRLERKDFIDRNLDSPLQLLTPSLAKLVAMGGMGRLDRRVARFFHDERLQRIFSFQAMYAGLAPSRARALYAVIAYLDSVAGVSVPIGGMHAVPRALAGAAAKHGVVFRYSTTVSRIEVMNGVAQAVHTTDGERLGASAVVINADAPIALSALVDVRPRKFRRLRYSPSCVVLHAGSTAHYPQAAHHNIEFGQAWESTFTQIIDAGTVMTDPSFLLTNPTFTDPALAPAGRQTYYALFPTPNLVNSTIDWTEFAPRYRDQVLQTLESRGYTGFSDSIEVSEFVTPADWAAAGLAGGTPFAAAHVVRQTGPFRMSTASGVAENLVLCGSNVQPGVGVPMVLMSGRLAAERLLGTNSR